MNPRRGDALAARLACLAQVADLGAGRLPDDVVSDTHAVLARARQRVAAGDHLVVAGLLGGTGSGKSSLFNRLVGRAFAPVGVVRPITADSRAAVVGETAEAERLLDWLGVDHRHYLAPGPGLPLGLVLLDLPDHDSVALEHAVVADRFAERVDLLLWVVDPLKYAHEALYDRYLRNLTAHAGVTVVVLNRADELSDADRLACAADLRRRLDGEGLGAAEVIVTSATSGLGIEDLQQRVIHETDQRRAAAERITSDVRAVAARAAFALPSPPAGDELPVDAVSAAVGTALGVPAILDEARETYREVALAHSRSPASALLRFAARPLARVALLWTGSRARRLPVRQDEAGGTGQPAEVRRALLDLGQAATDAWPPPAGRALRRIVTASTEPLLEESAKAVRAATAPPRRRRWWQLLPLLPAATEIVAFTGLLWLAALGFALLRLPDPPTVATPLGDLLVPTVLFLGGLTARVAAGGLRGFAVRLGARRHRAATAAALDAAVGSAVRDHVQVPLEEELEATRALAAAVRCALDGPHEQRRPGR